MTKYSTKNKLNKKENCYLTPPGPRFFYPPTHSHFPTHTKTHTKDFTPVQERRKERKRDILLFFRSRVLITLLLFSSTLLLNNKNPPLRLSLVFRNPVGRT